jgi:hypothetical protein
MFHMSAPCRLAMPPVRAVYRTTAQRRFCAAMPATSAVLGHHHPPTRPLNAQRPFWRDSGGSERTSRAGLCANARHAVMVAGAVMVELFTMPSEPSCAELRAAPRNRALT